MDQWSGVFDTVKKSHVGDNVRLWCSNTRLLILSQVMVYLKVRIKLKSHWWNTFFKANLRVPLVSRCHCSDITLWHTGCEEGEEWPVLPPCTEYAWNDSPWNVWHLRSYFISFLHFLNSDMTVHIQPYLNWSWERIEMTYQKAKACVINTSLAGWIAEGDKSKVLPWIQIDVQ